MPAQWTGKIVGEIHNNRLTCKELAKELDWNEKYLSQVLNSDEPPKGAEQKVSAALDRLIERKRQSLDASASYTAGLIQPVTES